MKAMIVERPVPLNRRVRVSDDSDPPLEPGRKKRKTPKVKTGCYSCRKRRVKCDEKRPNCHRCNRCGIVCEGYPAGVRFAKELAPISRPLAPNPQSPLPPYSRTISPISPISPLTISSRFEDEQQGLFFRKYMETATHIRGPIATSLWERLIPQSCEAEPYIRHAAVAVGAMSKTLAGMRLERDELHSAILSQNPDYVYALSQYDKALSGMRHAMGEGRANMRNAIFACLLVFCFENMNGRPALAAANAISGLVLFYDFLRKTKDKRAPGWIKREFEKRHIEDDLQSTLIALDLHVIFIMNPKVDAFNEIYIAGSDSAISKMPAEFPSLKIARHFWMVIMGRNHHFLQGVVKAGWALASVKPEAHDEGGPCEEGTDVSPGIHLFSMLEQPPMHMFDDMLRYREHIRRWSRASASLFNRISKSGTQVDKTAVLLLQINESLAHAMLAGAFCSTQSAYDEFLPEYQQIIDGVELVYPHLVEAYNGEPLYRFDLGIIMALFFVGSRCRDRKIRDRAAHFLNRNKDYREGMWDTGSVGAIVNFIIEVEEEKRDQYGEIAEEDKVSVAKGHLDIPNRTGLIKLSSKKKQGIAYIERAISW
ncbi:hypothetical protein L207DRAFT_527027 [Hyaloscypha variabilis F]|uniref:Zn(2)-C6 fungal-type domain-containing protein n=1 Tax=Hyaloscypha variabilis (strain UAMH 11265 / GT02V1 / F) TaxID=1149755 RepID=A0A2J6RU73_HYAVF|nr:hypothetical protein L207DRAFT_527027 [Hyaloscypha variabilis F]